MNTKKRYRKLILWCLGLDLIAMLCLGYRYLDRRIPDELHVEEGQESQVQKVLEHPLLMKWSSTLYADFRTPGTKGHLRMKNHNNLLPGGRYASPGVDGLKTGFIARSGYCVTVTCLRNGKRMIVYPTARERDQFLRQLLSWGYSRADDPAAALAETRKQASQVRTTTKTAAKKKTAVKRTVTKKKSRNN